MRAKCISSDGQTLSKEYHNIGFTSDSTFDIKTSNEYIIYGVCWWRGILLYLIHDETLTPNWYPASLFSMTENSIPKNWAFNATNNDEYSAKAVLGYPELLMESHYSGLIERNKDSLDIFYRAKSEIDQMYIL